MNADSIREYLTGADSDGAVQNNPALSLGGFASSKQADGLAAVIENPIKGCFIDHIAPSNPIGLARLIALDDKTLIWHPLDSTRGETVTFGLNTSKIVEANGSPQQFIRVTRKAPFSSTICNLYLMEPFNNVFGFSNILSSVAATGINHYRATILKNITSRTLTAITRQLVELGTVRTSAAGQLGLSGSGTLSISSGTFDDWPTTGWCRIVKADLSLREVVYYSLRSSTILTIPTDGRARFGTVASAGANDDTLHPISGVAIGLDDKGVEAANTDINIIANETTEPPNVTWTTGTLSIPDLPTNTRIGIWMWRQIPAGAIFEPGHRVRFRTVFTGV